MKCVPWVPQKTCLQQEKKRKKINKVKAATGLFVALEFVQQKLMKLPFLMARWHQAAVSSSLEPNLVTYTALLNSETLWHRVVEEMRKNGGDAMATWMF